jgi:hypothetical protein
MENSHPPSQQSMSGFRPEEKKKKKHGCFSFFFPFFLLQTSKKQSINQNQLCNILDSSPVESHLQQDALKTADYFSLPAGSKVACMKLQKEQVSITHHA